MRYVTLRVGPSLIGTLCRRNQQWYENLMVGRSTAAFTYVVLSRSPRDFLVVWIMWRRGML